VRGPLRPQVAISIKEVRPSPARQPPGRVDGPGWCGRGQRPLWSPSSPCCRRTSWAATAGTPATSYAWRSSPGSRTYHRRRRPRALGRLAPTEYEVIHTKAAHGAREPLTESLNQTDSSPVGVKCG